MWSGFLPVDRTVDWDRSRSIGPVDWCARARLNGLRVGRPSRELCSLDLAPVDRAVDRWHNGRKSDRWPVDRAVDRTSISCWFGPTASFWKGYKYPSLWAALKKNFTSKIFHLLKCFSNKFSRIFGLSDIIFICFQKLENSKKNRVFGILVLIFISILF